MENEEKMVIPNPFYVMGFDIDINDEKIQKDILKKVKSRAKEVLFGYNYNCYNYYGKLKEEVKELDDGIQLSYYEKENEKLSLKEKMDRLVIHHTNEVVWESIVEQPLSRNACFIKPKIDNSHGMAIIHYMNVDYKPYITHNTEVVSQVNCFAFDFKSFHTSEKGENNFSFKAKLKGKKEDKIYLRDNCIMMAAIFNSNPKFADLNLVRGTVLRLREITSTIFGKTSTYDIVDVDTEFGITSIIYSSEVISYMPEDHYINVGDTVEALCYISGDLMLNFKNTKTVYDKENLFDIVRRAFETKNMSWLENVLAEDCEFHSDCNTFIGKEEILNRLQSITDKGYGDIEVSLKYAMITRHPIKHFKLGEEVLCLCKEDGVEGEINIELNKNKLIQNIYLTNDPKINFMIYNDDGSLPLTDINQPILKELLDLLKKKELSELDINAIFTIIANNMFIAKDLIKYIKNNQDSTNLCSDILNELIKLFHKFEKKHPHKKNLRINLKTYTPYTFDEEKSIYSLKYVEDIDNSILDVTYRDPDIGALKVLKRSKLNYIISSLDLAYMNLNDLKDDSRINIKPVDLYKSDKTTYSFEKVAKEFEENAKKYKEIYLWTNHRDANGYLLPFYFINRFYKKIKNKKIYIIYTDEFGEHSCLDNLKVGEFDKLLNSKKLLTIEEIEQYRNEWEEISKVKCDIRDINKGKIEYKSIKDYYKPILKLLESTGEINRVKFIGNLIGENIMHSLSIDIWSYIIDKMIEEGLIISRDYNVPQFTPNDKISVIN